MPYFKVNDTIVFSNSTSFDSLKAGEIIVFSAPEAKSEDGKPKIIVHRISEVGTYFGKKVVTAKGDANQYSLPGIDFPIFQENYIGKVLSVTNVSTDAGAESDFTLELKTGPVSEVTKFIISGESDKEICPSGQCSIYSEGQYTYFHGPSPNFMSISTNFDFTLQDNITNADLGPKKKEFMEQFNVRFFCNVDDIIEENGQELYYCDGDGSISRKFDSKTWDYDATAVYDAKNNTLQVSGNYSSNLPSTMHTTSNTSVTTDNMTSRTFQDCVTDNMGVLTLALIFAPSEELDVTDLLDPAYKKLIINACNFYHEKTGIWINLMDSEHQKYAEQYGNEFFQKYGNTIPESIRQEWNQSYGINK